MTESDLIQELAEARKLSKTRAKALVRAAFASIEEALRRGERVEIRSFGSFEIRRYGSYTGRNPRTGSSVAVKPKLLPFFRASKEMKDQLNLILTRTQDFPALSEAPALPAAQGGGLRAQARR